MALPGKPLHVASLYMRCESNDQHLLVAIANVTALLAGEPFNGHRRSQHSHDHAGLSICLMCIPS